MKTKNPKLDNLMKEMNSWEKKTGFDKTDKKQLVKWIKKELKDYEKAKTKEVKENKLMDIIVLVMQIAKRDKASLDSAWKKWWIKSEKYLR